MLTFSAQFWTVSLTQITTNSQLRPHPEHTQLLSHAHSQELRDTLRDILRDTFRDILRDTLRDMLRDTLRDILRDTLRDMLSDILRDILRDTLRDITWHITWCIVSISAIRSEAEAKASTWWRPRGGG